MKGNESHRAVNYERPKCLELNLHDVVFLIAQFGYKSEM